MPELAARLNAAAEARATVGIRYAVASRATAHRIVPVAATATVLRARDLDTGRVRVFLLQHLELIEAPPSAPALPPSQDDSSLREHERLAAHVRALTNFGWHVTLSSEGLAVHRPGPDGMPLSVEAASIRRNAGTAATIGLVRRPWRIVAPGRSRARSFRSLDEAIYLFLRQAAQHAPVFRGRPITQSSAGRLPTLDP